MSMSDELPPLVLDRLADRADYAVVGPTDGRTRVVATTQRPYAAICYIERDFGDGRLSGCSGFLVSSRVVVTAGHCVFSHPRVSGSRRGATGPPALTDRSGRSAGSRTGSSLAAAIRCSTSESS